MSSILASNGVVLATTIAQGRRFLTPSSSDITKTGGGIAGGFGGDFEGCVCRRQQQLMKHGRSGGGGTSGKKISDASGIVCGLLGNRHMIFDGLGGGCALPCWLYTMEWGHRVLPVDRRI